MLISKLAADLPREASRPARSASQAAPEAGIQYASDGAKLWWGDADAPAPPAVVSPRTPVPVTVAVSPIRPGHSVAVEYRVNGGPVRQAIATPGSRAYRANARIFRAVLPGQPSGTAVEFAPVLRFAGQPISPRLGEAASGPRYFVGGAAEPPVAAEPSPAPSVQPNTSGDGAQRADLPLQWRVLSDGTACPLPIRFFDGYGLRATFLVDFDRAAEVLKGTGLKPVAQENGRAMAGVGGFEYRNSDIGPYNEFALTLLAAAPGDPVPADYISDLAVTTALANRAGRELWGYNKFIAAIEGVNDAGGFSMTVRDSGNATIGALEGARRESIPAAPFDELLFSTMNGRVIKALLRVMTPVRVCAGDRFSFRIGPSRHPMANNLRNLGLDGARPALVQYVDPYQAMLFPGRAI